MPKKSIEHYDGQFTPVTIPLRGTGMKKYQEWYMLVISAAFQSGITTGW